MGAGTLDKAAAMRPRRRGLASQRPCSAGVLANTRTAFGKDCPWGKSNHRKSILSGLLPYGLGLAWAMAAALADAADARR